MKLPNRSYFQNSTMGCKLNPSTSPVFCKFQPSKPELRTKYLFFSSSSSSSSFSFSDKLQRIRYSITDLEVPSTKANSYTVSFSTERDCRLGISRYPDFEYNAQGGRGTGSGDKVRNKDNVADSELFVSFDLETLYIPPLTSSTTKFLGLPLPPFLKIDIVPLVFQGIINKQSGKVDLEFKAKFLFSAGSVYKAPPLLVKTVLTSEESKGAMKSGRGKRLNEEGKCKLVGVATVDPIHDFFMNSFLGLPTECLAELNSLIIISKSS
ncbi:uncharacterized protein LOC129316761 [Prosopis cineraria]|uniref:uncharacterized protein LOC129316761 n=1 Tax=Prosopis cineraria TaxID=364024 RepID=UPI00240F3D68|nr:uncharacterized protein LOC129316761 [Prosopis cineraria]